MQTPRSYGVIAEAFAANGSSNLTLSGPATAQIDGTVAPIQGGDGVLIESYTGGGGFGGTTTVEGAGGNIAGSIISLSHVYSGTPGLFSFLFTNTSPAPAFSGTSTGNIIVTFDTFWT